jgi:hypothetical protein
MARLFFFYFLLNKISIVGLHIVDVGGTNHKFLKYLLGFSFSVLFFFLVIYAEIY